MAFDVSFRSGDFGISYSDRPVYDFFNFGSWQNFGIFAIVFVIGFIVSYIGLKKFFTKKEPNYQKDIGGGRLVSGGGGTVIENKSALIVLSCATSLLMTFGLLRNGWLFYYFGDIAGVIGSFLIIGIFLIIFFAMFKFVGAKFGNAAGSALSIAAVWGVIYWVVNESLLIFRLPLRVQEGLEVLAKFPSLIVFLIIGFVLGKIFKK
jgi:magnesium-transporting ATPase (P-type)